LNAQGKCADDKEAVCSDDSDKLIDKPPPQKACSECANENLSKICVDTSKKG